jgi:dTMP kinase
MTFVALEGIDGSGKTTVAEALRAELEARGLRPLLLREPGSTPLGERVRRLLLDPDLGSLSPWTEVALFTACRAEMVAHEVRPALDDGRAVLLDRYYYSTLAYQADAHGLQRGVVTELSRLAVDGLEPRPVLLLDLPVKVALARQSGPADRMEAKGAEFLERVRQSYRRQAAEDPGRWRIIDAAAAPAEVARAARVALAAALDEE